MPIIRCGYFYRVHALIINNFIQQKYKIGASVEDDIFFLRTD